MNYNEMMRQLEIIFENQIQQGYKSFYEYKPQNKSVIKATRRITSISIAEGYREIELLNIEISKNPEYFIVENENLELLMKLYERIKEDPSLVSNFKSFLKNTLEKGEYLGEYRKANYLSFFALYRMEELEDAFRHFTYGFDIKSTSVTYTLLTIGDILIYDYPNLKDEQLDKIKKYFHETFPKIFTLSLKNYVEIEKMLVNLELKLSGRSSIEVAIETLNKALIGRIIKLITDIQFSRLQTFYETDSEIKEHQEIVEKQIVELGLPKEISEALAWCRRKYDAISDDEFEISSAIGKLRNIWNDYKKEMSLKINKKTETEIPKHNGIPEYVKYITDSLDLKNEKKLIGGLQKVLNSEGGHALASEKLYFKLTLNILVEVIYLINEKYKNWEKS